ncbi:MAG: hypothetical protein V1659_03295 [Candidatus Woesearchaeota archaeon]
MTTFQILEKSPVSMSELRAELKKIKKRDGELSFRSNRTNDYLDNFSLLSKKDADSVFEDISKLNIPRLKPEYITKLVDLLPKSVEEVKVILSGYGLTINNENIQKMLDILKKYAPES